MPPKGGEGVCPPPIIGLMKFSSLPLPFGVVRSPSCGWCCVLPSSFRVLLPFSSCSVALRGLGRSPFLGKGSPDGKKEGSGMPTPTPRMKVKPTKTKKEEPQAQERKGTEGQSEGDRQGGRMEGSTTKGRGGRHGNLNSKKVAGKQHDLVQGGSQAATHGEGRQHHPKGWEVLEPSFLLQVEACGWGGRRRQHHP